MGRPWPCAILALSLSDAVLVASGRAGGPAEERDGDEQVPSDHYDEDCEALTERALRHAAGDTHAGQGSGDACCGHGQGHANVEGPAGGEVREECHERARGDDHQ